MILLCICLSGGWACWHHVGVFHDRIHSILFGVQEKDDKKRYPVKDQNEKKSRKHLKMTGQAFLYKNAKRTLKHYSLQKGGG